MNNPTCFKWFAKFHDIHNKVDQLRGIAVKSRHENQCYITQKITSIHEHSRSSNENYLHQFVYGLNNFDLLSLAQG